MKKIKALLSFLLVVIMVAGALASCTNIFGDQETQTSVGESTSDSSNATESGGSVTTTDSGSETTTESGSETTTESGSETTAESGSETTTESGSETDDPSGSETTTESDSETADKPGSETTEAIKYNGTNEELIQNAQNLAGTVNSYYENADRNHYIMENSNAILKYSLKSENFQGFASVSNKNGVDYIKDTMVAFVTMRDGSTHYSSNSYADTQVNIYRFGYYYYENRLECEVLMNTDSPAESETKLDLSGFHDPKGITKKYKDGVLSLVINSIDDPRIYCDVDTEDCNFLKITMKAELSETSKTTVQVRFTYNSEESYNDSALVSIDLVNDGEYHTYYVPLSSLPGFEGKIHSMRLDLDGGYKGDRYDVSEISFEKRTTGEIYLARAVHMYSDKVHQTLQFAVKNEVNNIGEIGMITKIAKDTVAKVVVEDKNGIHYSFEGVDWSSAEYVGFDIAQAGIFGYILPDDRFSGKIIVTEEDGMYVIKQYVTPRSYTISPSPQGTENENDYYMGQRIYTDDSHDFANFLKEAYCERNPLGKKNFIVHSAYSEDGEFLGYDPLRGSYILNVKSIGFLGAFLTYPNRHFGVNFTVVGDDMDRNIYVMTSSNTNGTIENGVVLNDKNMLLPIPVEVAKNFPGDGEANMFNVDDVRYSEAIIPFIAGAGTRQEITILNLYQNWGKYPLKQLSSIQFYCPFYHFSTGTTETNCIRHMYDTKEERALMYLPDHRAWSAPYWHEMGIGNSQPQHTNGGNHYFLQYTDADGKYVATELVSDTIISSGPTYAELEMEYITDDRKMQVTHTHMEMPQNDENRTYYTIEYKVLEDVSIEDFRQNFSIYSVSEKTTGGYYRYIGYLDKNNEYAYADSLAQTDAVADGTQVVYELGDVAPYFSFFYIPDYTNYEIPGYVNVSFIIANTEITINGEKYEPKFLLYNEKIDGKVYLRLTLDLDNVTLKAGDTFKMNAIITPWGSQELNHQKYDAVSNQLVDVAPVDGKFYYNTVIGTDENGDPIYYMDKNVRDIRENSVLSHFEGTAVKDCELENSKYTFMPLFRTTNGKSAEFTISGGENNVATRIYGFDTLTVPKIEEFVNEEWVEYEVCSINTPDGKGYGHLYDGYMVYYDADGTYSYSFVTTITDGAPRTFRITVDGEFEGFPDELVVVRDGYYQDEDYKFYFEPDTLDEVALDTLDKLGNVTLENGYISFYGNPDRKEGYITPISEGNRSTGRYLVIKYRFPNTNKTIAPSSIEIFASTKNEAPKAEDGFYASVTADGKWHILVIDLAATKPDTYVADDSGDYVAKYLRIDILNEKNTPATDCINIAYIATFNEYEKAIAFDKDIDYVTYMEGAALKNIDPNTGEEYVIKYNKNESYHDSDVAHGSCLEGVNGKKLSGGLGGSSVKGPEVYSLNSTTVGNSLVYITGWTVVEGGFSKIVWSADGGKTWNDATFHNLTKFGNGGNDHITVAQGRLNNTYTFVNPQASYTGITYQGTKYAYYSEAGAGVAADLTAYIGQTVDVTFAAIPNSDPNGLCYITHILNVEVVAPGAPDEDVVNDQYNDLSSGYVKSQIAHSTCLDSVNGLKLSGMGGNSIKGPEVYELNGTTLANNRLAIAGFTVVEGGFEKIVWSADGGKTWHEASLRGKDSFINGDSNHITHAETRLNGTYTFVDRTASVAGCRYQSSHTDNTTYTESTQGVEADLSAYAGQTVSVTFAAVPKGQPNSLCYIAHITGVQVPAAE